jgi:multiple sugar transport system substrate-binding protein
MAVAMKWPRHRTPKIDGEGEMIMKKALPTWRCVAAVVAAAAITGCADPARAQITLVYSDWHLAEVVAGRAVREAFVEFEKENPDIKIKAEPVALAQRDLRFTTALRAGKGPDVFALDSNPVSQYVKEGWVMDLTPFLQKEGGTQYLSDFYPTVMAPVTLAGKIYGMPVFVAVVTLLSNTELLRTAGIADPPKTWAEFREDAKTLTRATKEGGAVDQWGAALVMAPAGFDLRFSAILRGFGGDYLTPDNRHSAVDSPQARDAFNLVIDMILKDKSMPPGIAQIDANGERELMSRRKVAMEFEPQSVPNIADLNPQLDAFHVLQSTPVPQNPGHETPVRTTLLFKALFINPHTEHPAEAWRLIRFLMEPRQMEKWFVITNLLPPRRSVNETFEAIREDRFATVARGEIEHAAFLPAIPQWPEILETFRQNLQAAVAKSKTPDQALGDAHTAIEAILGR